MMQDSSQNDNLWPEKLEVWLKWLSQNTASVQDTTDIASEKQVAEIEVPDSIIEMLRCIISLPSMPGHTVMGQDQIKQCLDRINKNAEEVALFFRKLQESPATIIPLMQKLGRPLPLPLKDLIRAMEEVARDTTSDSEDLRRALSLYLGLLKQQQRNLILLMQDSVDAVSESKNSRVEKNRINYFIDDWVQEFESKYVQYAQKDQYSKDLGELINACVQVLKEQRRYRDHLRNK